MPECRNVEKMTHSDEIYYSIALTRMTGFNQQMALQLYQSLGSAMAVYEHRNDIGDVIPDTTPRLRDAMKNWDDALKRAAVEMAFVTKNNIRVLTLGDADYPQRLLRSQHRGYTSLHNLRTRYRPSFHH